MKRPASIEAPTETVPVQGNVVVRVAVRHSAHQVSSLLGFPCARTVGKKPSVVAKLQRCYQCQPDCLPSGMIMASSITMRAVGRPETNEQDQPPRYQD